jgi:hypothetical protein
MKKIIAFLLLLVFASLNLPVLAKYVLADSVQKNMESIAYLMQPCSELLDQATKNSSSQKMTQFCECALKQDLSSLDEKTQKDFKNTIYTMYIPSALENHKITKKNKYLNKAHKISKKAVKNEICNADILKLSIMIASFKGSPSDASKAYTQLCEVNKKECEAIYNDYDEMYNQAKTQQKENRKWIRNTGWALLIALAAFGGAYAGANAANNKRRSMTCQTIGNSTYCNEY